MASTSGTYRPSNHHGFKEDGTPDKRMNTSDTTYKPSHHDGLKEDGTPDKRMNTGREYFKTPSSFNAYFRPYWHSQAVC